MKNEIVLKIFVENKNITIENLIEWLSNTTYFEPTKMMCTKLTNRKYLKYDKTKLYENAYSM